MNGQNTSSPLDSALASFHNIIDGQIESIAALEIWLRDRRASDAAYQDIASVVCRLLVTNKAQLLEAKRTHTWPSPPGYSSWGPVTWTRNSSEILIVSGVGSEPRHGFEFHTSSESEVASIESFASVLASAFDNLGATEGHIAQLAQLIEDMETYHVSGSPAETVQNHIRLLGQYNDAKDIAQQLIGLIADNRGVPVGSLYQENQYGVGPND